MPLQPPQFVGNLDSSNPIGTDSRTIADDSIRNFKEGVRMSFPIVTGAVSSSHGDLNLLAGFATAGRKIMTGQGGTTKALFANPSAPTGWTIDGALTAGQMVVTAGTINGTATAGGDTSGTNDPGINNTVPNHRHFVVADEIESTTQVAVTASNQIVRRRDILGTSEDYNTSGTVTDATIGRTSENAGAANWVPKFTATIVCTLDA